MTTETFVIRLDSARDIHDLDKSEIHVENFKNKIDLFRSAGWKVELVVPFELETHASGHGPRYSVTKYLVYCSKD